MKNFILLITLTFLTFSGSFAQTKQSIGVDTLKIGNSASAHNPTVEFAGTDVKLRANKSSGAPEFTKDGSVWKKLGSGSGSGDGGYSILENPSFEDGLTPGWVNSGGTFSHQTYTNGVEGETKYARFVSTVAGEYFETVADVIPDFSKGGCLAKVNYNTVDASNWKIQVYSGADLLKEENLYAKSWQDGFASFPCPSSGASLKLRIISLGAGQIEADKGYLGKENRTFQASKPSVAAISSHGASTAGLGWRVYDGAMSVLEKSDSLLSADTGAKTFTSKVSGKFKLTAIVDAPPTTANIATGISVNSTAAPIKGCVFAAIAGDSGARQCSIVWDIAANDILRLMVYTSGSLALTGGRIELEYLGSGTDTALVPEAQDWFIDVNIGGANASLGTASVSTYTEITASAFDMVINPGSASAKIPCSGSNASTGVTCASGNEGIGVNFKNPAPGFYEVCGSFSQSSQTGVGTLLTAFQFVETENSSQTIIQEGKTRTLSNNTLQNATIDFPFHSCGTFYFSSVKERTVRLMYEQIVGGTVNASFFIADRIVTAGQRDAHIVVRPLLSSYNRPYLTGDQVTTPGEVNPVLYSAHVDGLGVVSGEIGDLINGNCTVNASSPFQITCTPTTFSKLNCTISPVNATDDSVTVDTKFTNQTNTIIRWTSKYGGTPSNGIPVKLVCHGVR